VRGVGGYAAYWVASDEAELADLAVHPEHQTLGLGSLLVARCQARAGQLGYRRAIHAMLHDRNDSRKISQRDETRTIRQYALFSKPLRLKAFYEYC